MSFALITGASSGIGYELAPLFAKNRYDLILVSRQGNRLVQLADGLKKKYTIEILNIPIDLSHTNAAEEIFRLVQEKIISVNYLVNNAGFYVKGAFTETSWEEAQKLIQLQCLNHTQLTKLFLPDMLKRGKGGILNVGSTGSFVPGPYNAVYCAAKSFVLSFSEALAEEVSGSGVAVTALCPGGTYTGFQDFSKRRKSIFFPTMEASRVAEVGYKALMKGKRIVIPGLANKIQVFLMRFIPRNLISKLTGLMVEK
ncbi:MAG: SDR family oxidoreductase [Candidatus Marinimicrobia bacterium]|nr:SDR family oxidoreductase [Candidatus Neomarinimicrobiota bacterium]